MLGTSQKRLCTYIFSLNIYRCYSIPPGFTLVPSSVKIQGTKDKFNLKPKDIADTLQNDPNLADFYEGSFEANGHSTEQPFDPFDLSDIPIDHEPAELKGEELLSQSPRDSLNQYQTMPTEQFVKFMNKKSLSSDNDPLISDNFLSDMVNKKFDKENHVVPNNRDNYFKDTTSCDEPWKRSEMAEFVGNDDVAILNRQPKLKQLSDIINTELPLVIISKLTDPRLNLSLEKYIYDYLPDPREPVNRFAKRLLLYKNSSCIVVGKNQNIFREVNMRLASTYSIPILRRFSGGGTVVHDLGNMNFSFMSSKDEFSRTAFTNELVKKWNSNKYTEFQLDINEKGDMVRKSDMKKVSGSAFQISKGRSLHHGTMLLNSDLKVLSKLLKIDPVRKANITDRATSSIPSPVTNTNIPPEVFIDVSVNSFLEKFGLPTNLESKINKHDFDNLKVLKTGNLEVQVLKINDLLDLPSEIWDTYKQLKSWDWIFGKTPRFQIVMSLDNNTLSLKFDVDKGRIISMEYDSKFENDNRLAELTTALSSKHTPVYFSTFSISKYIKDNQLLEEISWNIDQKVNLQNIGIKGLN